MEDMLKAGMSTLEFLGKTQQEQEETLDAVPLWEPEDLVMVGDVDRSRIEQDPVLRQLTSELRVWNRFRGDEALAAGIPLDVVLERTWDTAEDAFVHARRMAYEKGAAVLTPEEDQTRKTVVVLGSGWAAQWPIAKSYESLW